MTTLPSVAASVDERRAEASRLLDGLSEQSLAASPAAVQTAVSRIRYLGEETFASERLVQLVEALGPGSARSHFASALASVAAPGAEPALLSLLHDGDGAVRMAAVQGLRRIHSRRSSALLRALGDPTLGVRKEAALALGDLGEPRLGRPLIDAAKAEVEPDVRAALLVAVGRSRDRRQVAALEGLLRHPSGSTRLASARALCLLGAARGYAYASALLASADPLERLTGVELLEEIPVEASRAARDASLPSTWMVLGDEDRRAVFDRARELDAPARLLRLSQAFLRTPYAASPLGEGTGRDADPPMRFDAVDCQTFVEQVLALWLARTFDEVESMLGAIRYDGKVSYASRNHLMEAQWLPHNVRLGLLRDVTEKYGGAPADRALLGLSAASWNSRAARALGLPSAARPLGTFALPIVPLARAQAVLRRVPSGTLLLVVREDRPLALTRVSHLGFVVQRAAGPVLRHASKSFGRVVDEPIEQFLARHRKYERWRVAGVALYEAQLLPSEDTGL